MTTVGDAVGLAAIYADRVLVATTRDVHQAVLGRVLVATGLRRSRVGAIPEVMTRAVYGCVGLATRSVRHLTSLGAGGRLGGDLQTTVSGRRTQAIVNGLVGDALADQGSPMAIEPAVRRDGHDVELTPQGLGAAYPRMTPRLAVFVHGLCEDDEGWSYRCQERGPSYVDRLSDETDWSPVTIRYNSGRPIAASARDLVGLIDRLLEAWPVEVREIALVGHSMGGLVARSASGPGRRAWWAERVTHVVLLGSPHDGAALERTVDSAIPSMSRLAELAPFGAILEERSTGIRDLRHGIGLDAHPWPRAAYHCVAATLGSGHAAWLGRVFGDLLVTIGSARGDAAGLGGDFRHLPGAHHFDLLNHPVVHADLMRWLTGAPTAARTFPSRAGCDPRAGWSERVEV